eukprot:gi/632969687/ref/XP_007901216.1/ PREDICTED: eukaryotic translation initiation factor 4E transporter-like [Callorhinchus milii]
MGGPTFISQCLEIRELQLRVAELESQVETLRSIRDGENFLDIFILEPDTPLSPKEEECSSDGHDWVAVRRAGKRSRKRGAEESQTLALCDRQQRISRSPVPGNQQRLNSASPSQASSFTNMLSPSFTPTSVIRKMFESKEKGKDGKENQAAKECPEDGHGLIEDHLSPVSLLENSERGTSPIGMRPSTFPRSACTTPQLNQMRFTKDHDYRPKSAGRKTPTRASPIPGSPFSRPVCPAPLVSHVPFVRSSPPHLPPVVVQRMLAQGMTPQQFHPALVHAGLFPSGVDLSHLQGIPPPLLGQTFYPLPASGHPLLNTRATQMQSSGAPLQHLAVMRQAVLQSPNATAQGPGAQVLLNQQNSTVRGLHQRSGSPVNLSKWFGSDVLQQPLPSMPSKVISVDELELHQ